MEDQTADLIIRAFFFAMRSCEYVIRKMIGRTVTIHLGGVKFSNYQRKEIDYDHPQLRFLFTSGSYTRIRRTEKNANQEPIED